MSSTPYKQALILRKDLNMRKGKMVAQGAHACLGAVLLSATQTPGENGGGTITLQVDPDMWGWINGRFAKVCLGAQDLEELLEIKKAADEAGIRTCLIQDAGFTEFKGVPTHIALSVGPAKVEDMDPITGHLPLL